MFVVFLLSLKMFARTLVMLYSFVVMFCTFVAIAA